jgi:hypothetical protein
MRGVLRHYCHCNLGAGKTDVNRQKFHLCFVFICHTASATNSLFYNIIDRLCKPVAPFGSAGLGVAI